MKHLFGPVPSRRLGMSLGVDLVPHKVCTFDCIYCECGKTTDLTLERKEYVKYEDIKKELKEYFKKCSDPDYFTFSGSGEPTLNSCIGKVLKFIKKEKPAIPVAVLTNGSLLYQKDLREELLDADLILPSLDAVLINSFNRINYPHACLDIKRYIDGLVSLRKEYTGQIWLEILILPGYNDSKEDIEKLKETVRLVAPDKLQLNTLDRPGRIDDINAASKDELNKICKYLGYPNTEIIAGFSATKKQEKTFRTDIEDAICDTIHRRPCTLEDLTEILNLRNAEVNKYLSILESEDKVEITTQSRGKFYKLKERQETSMAKIKIDYKGDMLFESMIGNHKISIDVPDVMDGKDRAPTPPQLFIASLGSCIAAFTVQYCKQAGIDATDMNVEVDFEKASDKPKLKNLKAKVNLPNGKCGKRLKAVKLAAEQCPVHNTIVEFEGMELEIVSND